MMKIVYCTVFCFLTVACDGYEYIPPDKIEKTIIEKASPNENRFSPTELVFNGNVVTKTQTVYYLIAEDGTMCEVEIKEFYSTNVGDKYSCFEWS